MILKWNFIPGRTSSKSLLPSPCLGKSREKMQPEEAFHSPPVGAATSLLPTNRPGLWIFPPGSRCKASSPLPIVEMEASHTKHQLPGSLKIQYSLSLFSVLRWILNSHMCYDMWLWEKEVKINFMKTTWDSLIGGQTQESMLKVNIIYLSKLKEGVLLSSLNLNTRIIEMGTTSWQSNKIAR